MVLDDKLAKLHERARNVSWYVACDAIETLEQIGDESPETLELLVDLMGGENERIAKQAIEAISQLGSEAIAVVIERIGASVKPSDARLIFRGIPFASDLLPLARILVRDAEPARACAAEAIVACCIDQLSVDEVIDVYIAMLDREREEWSANSRSLLGGARKRFQTADARRVIAERWLGRELRAWTEQKLETRSIETGNVLALLIAGPEDAEPMIRQAVATSEDRWAAIGPMLHVDLERVASVLRADPELATWAEHEVLEMLSGAPRSDWAPLLAIALCDSHFMADAILVSPAILLMYRVTRTLKPPRLRAALTAAVTRGGPSGERAAEWLAAHFAD